MIRKAIQLLLFDLTIWVAFGALFYSSFSLPKFTHPSRQFSPGGFTNQTENIWWTDRVRPSKKPLYMPKFTSRPTIKLNL